MPNFKTSIELLSASEKDFDTLVTEMKKNAFMPAAGEVKKAEKQKVVFTGSTATLLDASTLASRAAERTGKKFSYTIIKNKD